MRRSSVLVWIPLRPGSKWIGEGIAGTVDRILKHLDDTEVNVVALAQHATLIRNNNSDSIKFYPVPQVPMMLQSLEGVLPPRLKRLLRLTEHTLNIILYVLFVSIYFFTLKMNRKIQTVWCPSFAVLFASSNFSKQKVVNFWDAFVFEYYGFSRVQLPIFIRIERYLRSAGVIVTQSRHNKSYLIDVFDIPEEKVLVVPNPNPQVRHILPDAVFNSIKNDRNMAFKHWKKTSTTLPLGKVKDICNLSMLRRFTHEMTENSFTIFCSTQRRPYKGFDVLISNLSRFSRRNPKFDIRLILTGDLEAFFDERILDLETLNWVYTHCYQISRVNNFNHALLYTMSDLVMHPSYAEGGHGVYPLFEAASVGTPCLMNVGRHTDEILMNSPKLRANILDFSNYDEFETELKRCISDQSHLHMMLSNAVSIANNDKESISQYLSVLQRAEAT